MTIHVIEVFTADRKRELESFKEKFLKTLGFPVKVKFGIDPTGKYPESTQVYVVYLERMEEYRKYYTAHIEGRI